MFPFHKHSGHCYFGDPIPGSGVIPDTYVPVCPNPMKPPIPSEIPDNKFVTKRELNEILIRRKNLIILPATTPSKGVGHNSSSIIGSILYN